MADSLPDSDIERTTTRDRILDAAERVVMRDGAGRLTIDAVVRESGFSKGGVLYNFPSKPALVEAMVERLISSARAEIEALAADAEAEGLSPAGALVHALVEHSEKNHELSMGLLAASAEQPQLLDPARAYMQAVRERLAALSPDPALGTLAMLAADGLHFGRMLKLYDISPEARAALRDRLVALVSET